MPWFLPSCVLGADSCPKVAYINVQTGNWLECELAWHSSFMEWALRIFVATTRNNYRNLVKHISLFRPLAAATTCLTCSVYLWQVYNKRRCHRQNRIFFLLRRSYRTTLGMKWFQMFGTPDIWQNIGNLGSIWPCYQNIGGSDVLAWHPGWTNVYNIGHSTTKFFQWHHLGNGLHAAHVTDSLQNYFTDFCIYFEMIVECDCRLWHHVGFAPHILCLRWAATGCGSKIKVKRHCF